MDRKIFLISMLLLFNINFVIAAEEKNIIAQADRLFTEGNKEQAIDKIESYLLENDPHNRVGWEKSCVWNMHAAVDSGLETKLASALLDKAEHSCAHAVELMPNNALMHVYLANIMMVKKAFVSAFEQINLAEKLTNNQELSKAIINNKHYLLEQIGNNSVQIEVKLLNKYVDQNYKFIEPTEISDLNYAMLNKKIISDPKVAANYYNRAIFGLNNNQYDKLEHDFNQVIKLLPNWFAGYSGLAIAYMQNKQYKQAKIMLAQARYFNPEDKVTNFNYNLLQVLDETVVAYTVEELNNIKQVISTRQDKLYDFTNVLTNKAGFLRRDPTAAIIYEAYGDIYAQAKDPQYLNYSKGYYRKAIELGGNIQSLNQKLDGLKFS